MLVINQQKVMSMILWFRQVLNHYETIIWLSEIEKKSVFILISYSVAQLNKKKEGRKNNVRFLLMFLSIGVNNHGRANIADIDDILIVRKLSSKKRIHLREKKKKKKWGSKKRKDEAWHLLDKRAKSSSFYRFLSFFFCRILLFLL